MKNIKLPIRFLSRGFLIFGTSGFSMLMLCAGCGSGQTSAQAKTLSPSEKEVVSNISVDKIKKVTTNLTDPSMQGRGSGQAGGVKAALYLAEEFKQAGLEPLGDNGTFCKNFRFRDSEFRLNQRCKLILSRSNI